MAQLIVNELINKYNKLHKELIENLTKEYDEEISKLNKNDTYIYTNEYPTVIVCNNDVFTKCKHMDVHTYTLFMYIINNINNNSIILTKPKVSQILNRSGDMTHCINNLIKCHILYRDTKDKTLYHLDNRFIKKGISIFTLGESYFCEY